LKPSADDNQLQLQNQKGYFMLTKMLALMLVFLIADLGGGAAALGQNREPVKPASEPQALSKKEAKRVNNLKKFFKSLGVGPNARTEIRYANNTQLKGYVSESTDEYFVVTDENTGATTRVEYAQVEKVIIWPSVKTLMKREMKPSRFFKKLAIGAGIGFGVLFGACLITKGCQN
jgi:hypothetical protein